MTTIGIIGGTGVLGSAIATAWLETQTVTPDRLWVANRSGSLGRLSRWPEIVTTTDFDALAARSDVVLLALPPDQTRDLRFAAGNRLVISVMAGVTLDRLAAMTGSARIVRAMSNPAAALQLAYSPWLPLHPLTEEETATVTRLFSAIGATDRVATEDQIDRFTALTGPVPGFVAAFAEAVAAHAVRRGIPAEIARRATRQLFLSAGTMMSLDSDRTPADFVQEMIDYAGTTAAGLTVLRDGPLAGAVEAALDASYARSKTIG